MTDERMNPGEERGPLQGLPPELAELDSELLALEIEERPSFGPELESELSEAYGRLAGGVPAGSGGGSARLLAAAAVGVVSLVTIAVPPARASLANLSMQALATIGVIEQPTARPTLSRPASFDAEPLSRPRPPIAQPRIEVFDRPFVLDPATVRPATAERTKDATLIGAENLFELAADRLPRGLVRDGVSGVADVGIWVDAEGRPSEVRLVRGSGHDQLDRAALALAGQLHFEPATRDGRPVRSWQQLSVPLVPAGARLARARVSSGPPTPADRGVAGRWPVVEWTPERVESPPVSVESTALLTSALGGADSVLSRGLGTVEHVLSGRPPSGHEGPLQWRADAMDALERAIIADGSNPAPYLALGRVLAGAGSKPQAQRLFSTGLERAVEADRVPRQLVADLNFELGRLAGEVAREWRHLGTLNGNVARGLTCTRLGMVDAVPSVETLIQVNYVCPDVLATWLPRAFEPLSPDVDHGVEMVRRYEAAVAADPGHVEANRGLLLLDANERAWPRLRARAEAFARASEGHPHAYLFLGLALQRLEQPERAAEAFDLALERLPDAQVREITDPTVLMTAREEAEFLATSGWDRERTERRFWEERDPVLSTVVNERRVEHLARATHAFFRFGSTDTDAASVWIRYGAPRAIRVMGEGTELRTEFWDYWTLNLTFRRPAMAANADLTSEARTLLDHYRVNRPELYLDPRVDRLDVELRRGEGVRADRASWNIGIRVPEGLQANLDDLWLGIFFVDRDGGLLNPTSRRVLDERIDLALPLEPDAVEMVLELWDARRERGATRRLTTEFDG